ncbi:MAG: zinc-dependent peptidase [Epsilonproteobacteria bacterium]|nr:zinc-dependent peptidase [Campylobacterota bacterium]
MAYYLLLFQGLFALMALFLFWQSVGYFRRMYRYKRLKETPFPTHYQDALQQIPHYRYLPDTLKTKLHLLILLFIEEKEFIGAKINVNDNIKLLIAFYASLMRLGFEIGEKDNVNTIILYPHHFVVDDTQNIGGITHERKALLEGQSTNGTVILSLQDIQHTNLYQSPDNVIIHEFAHELDFEDGLADGTPLLPFRGYKSWKKEFGIHFEALTALQNEDFSHTPYALLGSYAATNEAEFFAVLSERFFHTPKHLKENFPKLYDELQSFYQIDPITLFITEH